MKRMIPLLSEKYFPGIEYIKKLENYKFIFILIITNSYITHKKPFLWYSKMQNTQKVNYLSAVFLCSAAEWGPWGYHTPLKGLRQRECAVGCSQASKAAVDPYNIFKTIKVSALTEISRIAKCRRLEKESFKGHTLWRSISQSLLSSATGIKEAPRANRLWELLQDHEEDEPICQAV